MSSGAGGPVMSMTAYVSDFRDIVALALAVTLFGVLLWIRRRRRHRAPAVARRGNWEEARPGIGLAFDRVLEGDLSGAETILENAVRAGGASRVDAIGALIAVLRAQGDIERAAQIVDRLAQSNPREWVRALQVRLALDTGELDRALEVVESNPDVSIGLQLASLCRSGRWREALSRYQERVPKEQQNQDVLGGLYAGCAADHARSGNDRAARKALRRALMAAPSGLLPLVVGGLLHPRVADRAKLASQAVERAPWLAREWPHAFPAEHGRAQVDDPVTVLLDDARSQYEAGERQVALGRLRDYLDSSPQEWRVRRLYDEWILEHGDPADWRSELLEILENLPTTSKKLGPIACRNCGFSTNVPFYICPSCDGLGTASSTDPLAIPANDGESDGDGLPAGRGPSRTGANMADLVREIVPDGAPGAG